MRDLDVEQKQTVQTPWVFLELVCKPAEEQPEAPVPGSAIETVLDDRRQLEPGERSILIVEDDAEFARILVDQAQPNDPADVVDEAIDGMLLTLPGIRRLEGYTVLVRESIDKSKVASTPLPTPAGPHSCDS